MFSTLKCFVKLGPKSFVKEKIKLPIAKFVHDTVHLYTTRTKIGVNNVREVLLRGTIIALITAILVWLSILMYISFYYAYVPSVSHERPVYLKFKACDGKDANNAKGMCSFPAAHIQLTERQRLLMMGQPYKIHLELEMPESPTNRDLGMFMVCADFLGNSGNILASSCRSTMLHYRSFLLDTIYKLVFSPFFVFGNAEESQHIHIELFSNFQDDDIEPATDIFIEIQTTQIEVYSAKFLINARFTGLKFLMYNWPVFSAAIGITSNLVFIAVVCMVCWYQIIHSEEYIGYDVKHLERLDSDSYMSSLDDDEDDDSPILGEIRFQKGKTEKNDFIEDIHDTDC